jgi:O-antigen/teichoic acid export membrane protein
MKAILKQTSYLFFAQILNRIISFFYLIYLARTLGVADFGLLTAALAYFAIFSAVADFGFNRYLIREVAKDTSKAGELLWNVVMLRITLTSVLFALFSLILYALDPDKIRVSLILLASIAILPQAIAFTFDAIFVATRKLQFSAVSVFISALTTALVGLYLVGQGFGPWGAVNALIIGQLVYAIALILFLYKDKRLILSKVQVGLMKQVLAGSLPYGLLAVLGLLYFRIDALLLSYIKGSYETGIYGAAYRFLEAVIFIPSAFSMALFPVLSRVHESSAEGIRKLYFKSFKIMLGLGLVVLAGYFFILPPVIKFLLPNYLPSIQAIKILSLSIPFMFIHVPAVTVLLSTDKYLKQVLSLSVLALSFNILANLIFIPKFGFLAAAWVTVGSEVLSFIIFFLLTKKKFLDKK